MSRLTTILLVLLLVVLAADTARAWLEDVGLDVAHSLGYTGKGVVVAIVSTGYDSTDPLVSRRVVCAVTIDSNGFVTPGAQDDKGIGSVQARLVVEAAPDAQLVIVKVPLDTCNGYPCPNIAALRHALNWLLNPVYTSGIETVECPKPNIVLLGLPIYNITLDKSLASLLDILFEKNMLVVVPVGDVAPGVINSLALSPYTISVAAKGYVQSSGLSVWSNALHDLPIEPDYLMPVDVACVWGSAARQTILTCSEAAAAELAGLAAVLFEAYRDLRASKPLPSELEMLIRSSIVEAGAAGVGKSAGGGWGVPNARYAIDMLASNARIEVCVSDGYSTQHVIVEVESHNGVYGGFTTPGSCLTFWVEPGYVSIRVFGDLDGDVWNTTVLVSPGRVVRVLAPKLGASRLITIVMRVFNEYDVALDYRVLYWLPPGWLPSDRHLPLIYANVSVQGGFLMTSLSCNLLSFAFNRDVVNLRLVIVSEGYVPKAYKLRVNLVTCSVEGYGSTVDLGDVHLVKAPLVTLIGGGVDAAILKEVLEQLGFSVTLAPPDESGVASVRGVVVLVPGSESKAYLLYEPLVSKGTPVVLLGESARVAGFAETLQAIILPGVESEFMPRFTPRYEQALQDIAPYTIAFGARMGTVYNVTSGLDSGIVLAYAKTPAGTVAEVVAYPLRRTIVVANLWPSWSSGRDPRYTWSLEAWITLSLALASAGSRLAVTAAPSAVTPLGNLTIGVYGFALHVDIYNTTVSGRLALVKSISVVEPNPALSFTIRVGVAPYGVYKVYAVDAVWGVAVAEYRVVPVLLVEPSYVEAGQLVTIRALGLPASSEARILFDNVTVAAALSDDRGRLQVSVLIPSIATPGVHVVGVVSNGVACYARIEVYVRRVLDVRVATPPVIESGMHAEAIITILLEGAPVDPTRLQISVNGKPVEPIRVARGVYIVRLPSNTPGVNTVFVNASLDERYVKATGFTLVSYTVVAPLSESVARAYEELVTNLQALAYNATLNLTSATTRLQSSIERLEDSIAALNKSMVENLVELRESIESGILALRAGQSSMLRGIEGLTAAVSSIRSDILSLRGELLKRIEDSATRVSTDVRVEMGKATSVILSRVSSLEDKVRTIYGTVRGVNERLLVYLYGVVGLALADLVLTLLVYLRIRGLKHQS